ncbi:MAG TPA: sulfotransferase, partial [Solirubrobacteraceae bacterium]
MRDVEVAPQEAAGGPATGGSAADGAAVGGSAASVWLPSAAGQAAAIAFLEGVGLRAVAAAPDDDARTLARLADAGVVAVGIGEPPRGAPRAARIAAAEGATPRAALAAVDHAREVASRPILVVGAPRSGTTWVLELLASHPRVQGVFESHLFAEEFLGHLRADGRWHPEGGLAADDHVGMPFGLGQLAGRAEIVANARRTAVTWLAGRVAPGHGWVAEKTPGHGITLDAIAEVLPEARVVHVVRDLRDVVVSRRAASWHPAPADRPLARGLAREWRRQLERVDRARERLPVHEVAYERLHADPLGEVARLFAFCGVPHDDELVRDAVARNAFDRLPYERGEGLFRRAGRVGDHRERLGLVDRALVAAE